MTIAGLCGATAGGTAIAQGPAADRERVGPVYVSPKSRATVRGGRPETGSIHVAWAPEPHVPDRADREALAEFERTSFPPDAGPVKTIVDEPPEAWMAKLRRPDLPVRWNRKTIEYLRYFRDDPRGKAMIRAWFRRYGRYERRIRRVLREVGVPEDLAFVALAESGFNPRARSRVGAGGMWQFMESTGRVYGLDRSYWLDERYDPVKSTYAAALYLKDLRARFGSWELALAAFNGGYALVMTTIKRHNTNNFWALCEIESGLPYATTNYVPKIVAAGLVGRNRATFAVDARALEADAALDWVDVEVEKSTALATIAELIDVDPELLRELNAQLVRGRTPPDQGEYTVRIPRSKLTAFRRGTPRLQERWARETTHAVKSGQKLASIARRYGTTSRKLRKLNGMRDSAELAGGMTLVVPAKGKGKAEPAAKFKPLAAVPKVEVGAGQQLLFFETTRASTPRRIADAFGVKWNDVVAWNDLDPQARVQSGQILQLVLPATFDPDAAGVVVLRPEEVDHVVRGTREHIEAGLLRRGLVRRGYKARRGDTLTKVSKRFKLTVGDLARINGFSRKHELRVGEILVVYVPKGRTRGTRNAPPPATPYAEPASPPKQDPSTAKTAKVPGKAAKKTKRAGGKKTTRKRRKASTPSTSRVPGKGSAKGRGK